MSKLGIKRATTTVDLVTDLDLLAEYEAAEERLERLGKEARPDRLNSSPEIKKAAKEVQRLEKAMADSVVSFKLRALKKPDFAKLEEEHPPRDDNDVDKSFGVNIDTFLDAAMPSSVVEATWKESGKKAEFSGSDWPEIAEDITNGQHAEFTAAILRINRGATTVPFSRSASIVTRG